MSIDKRFFETLTPLQRQAARKLEEKGACFLADPTYRSHYLNTTMRRGQVEMSQWLICVDPAIVNRRDNSGNTPLYRAINMIGSNKKKEHVELLIMAGADVNTLNHNGNTALHAAVCSGNIDLLFMLLHQGAHLNVANGSAHTPLHLALMAGNTAAFLLLTLCGADLDFIPPQFNNLKAILLQIALFVNMNLSQNIWELSADPAAEFENHLQWPPEEVLKDILDLLITPEQLPWQLLEPLFKQYSQQTETYLLARYPHLQPLLNSYREHFEKPIAAPALSLGENPLTFHAPPPPPRRHQPQPITLNTTVLQI